MLPDRCSAHPGRPAVDTCPVCERPRCGADRLKAAGGGCAVCGGSRDPAPTSGFAVASARERLVRAAVAANLVAVLWGFVQAQYVQAELFQFLSPAVLGVLAGGAATWAAGSPTGALGRQVRLVAVLYAVLGCAFGFVKEGTFTVYAANVDVLVPYAIAAAATWLWTTPPKPKRAT